MVDEKRLVHEFPNLQLYFHELLQDAFRNQKVEADEHISFYLVNLLSRFTQTESIQTDEEGAEAPLAILFCKAQGETPENKARLLKYLGDFSLFISGFFQESFNLKIVDLDYYVSMGGGAYHQLSSLGVFRNQQELFSMIFSELSSRFVQWVDVISEVSEASQINTQSDLLRLYEKFLRTGSERMRDILTKQGIYPNRNWITRYSH
ncbi:MAG: hypothetical protein U1F57_06855 [bacterium]